MLTKADIKLLVDTFPTRAEFDKKIEEIKREMATKEELRELKDWAKSHETSDKANSDLQTEDHKRFDKKLSTPFS